MPVLPDDRVFYQCAYLAVAWNDDDAATASVRAVGGVDRRPFRNRDPPLPARIEQDITHGGMGHLLQRTADRGHLAVHRDRSAFHDMPVAAGTCDIYWKYRLRIDLRNGIFGLVSHLAAKRVGDVQRLHHLVYLRCAHFDALLHPCMAHMGAFGSPFGWRNAGGNVGDDCGTC